MEGGGTFLNSLLSLYSANWNISSELPRLLFALAWESSVHTRKARRFEHLTT